jgi:hypothetical protein
MSFVGQKNTSSAFIETCVYRKKKKKCDKILKRNVALEDFQSCVD